MRNENQIQRNRQKSRLAACGGNGYLSASICHTLLWREVFGPALKKLNADLFGFGGLFASFGVVAHAHPDIREKIADFEKSFFHFRRFGGAGQNRRPTM
jgi:hypothetical protein